MLTNGKQTRIYRRTKYSSGGNTRRVRYNSVQKRMWGLKNGRRNGMNEYD